MGVRNSLAKLGRRIFGSPKSEPARTLRDWHACRLETLEPRQLLAADIQIGAVYLDPNDGLDVTGNTFTITWSGGAPGTQLTELVIDTDKLGDGLTIGDTFFDIAAGGLGAFGSHPYQTISANGFTVDSVSVVDGGTQLKFTFTGFDAGETFVFKIDVDEMGFFTANAVAEGNEFEASRLTATFTAPDYQTATGSALFFDAFDPALAASGLNLPPDSYMPPSNIPQPVYTAGAIFPLTQTPLPGSIRGHVDADTDDDCFNGIGETPLSGVVIELRDVNGNILATTTTDANGDYVFNNLAPGTYSVHERQPAGYLQGTSRVGSLGGVKGGSDDLNQIVMTANQHGVQYDFCEKVPTGISGYVDADTDGDCFNGIGETPLAGVTIELLDSTGTVIATTLTDANGYYEFTNLKPGQYGVHEVQPSGYLNGATNVGSSGGVHSATDTVTQVNLVGGVLGTHYDFCENVPATISGYVFQEGPTKTVLLPAQLPQAIIDAYTNSTGSRAAASAPIAGATVYLFDGTGNLVASTVTNAQGFYTFGMLKAGTYTVVEAQPRGYYDGKDTPGTTGGLVDEPGDRIYSITVAGGQASIENNFAELQVVSQPVFINPPPDSPRVSPPKEFIALNPSPLPYYNPAILDSQTPPDYYGNGQLVGYTWHLSVINAGRPRATRQVQLTADVRGIEDWSEGGVEHTPWTLRTMVDGEVVETKLKFGLRNGLPVVGDFNGDGRDDIGVFYRGEWFIDLNGNGEWDDEDLWAKLGTTDDMPATGDWDGDGKTDIAIYGRAWPGDPRAVANDPGLPDPNNEIQGRREKNMPPEEYVAPQGLRAMQLTSHGTRRADLIDHVFNYGAPGDRPLAGDWAGAGIDTIGVFRDGRWDLDFDGDGRFGEGDMTVYFGTAGDLPVIGDFDGDGADEIGVYRQGTWYIDTNGNHQLDSQDRVIEFGTAADLPVVGDWDGDGFDDIGVYHRGA